MSLFGVSQKHQALIYECNAEEERLAASNSQNAQLGREMKEKKKLRAQFVHERESNEEVIKGFQIKIEYLKDTIAAHKTRAEDRKRIADKTDNLIVKSNEEEKKIEITVDYLVIEEKSRRLICTESQQTNERLRMKKTQEKALLESKKKEHESKKAIVLEENELLRRRKEDVKKSTTEGLRLKREQALNQANEDATTIGKLNIRIESMRIDLVEKKRQPNIVGCGINRTSSAGASAAKPSQDAKKRGQARARRGGGGGVRRTRQARR